MLTPITQNIMIFLVLLTLVVPRKYVLAPFMLAACFVPTDQRFILAGLDFTVLRVLVLAGAARIFLRGETRPIVWNKFDKLLFAWVLCGALIYTVRFHTPGAAINRLGYLFDVLGLYWIFRLSLTDINDVKRVFYMLGFCAIALCPLVALEWSRGENPFSLLGRAVTFYRDGRYRCQAAFPHSIMLGLFFATLIPAFAALALLDKRKLFFGAAIGTSIYIVFATASSTPLATLMFVILMLFLFPYRIHGAIFMKGMIVCLTILHFIMDAPVWHLIARANIVGGSTGWHRFHLIDKAIKHLPEWFLIGCNQTVHWGMGLRDVTNQFILEGVRGGLITMILFIILLVMAARAANRVSLQPMSKHQQLFFWSLNVIITGHCVSFLGVSYFGQIQMLLYLNFAMIGILYKSSLKPNPALGLSGSRSGTDSVKTRSAVAGRLRHRRARRYIIDPTGRH